MTVNEFIAKVPERCRDYELTVEKSDRGQLRCFTTVPVGSVKIGFDYTSEQVIIEPSIRLSTAPEVVDENRTRIMVEQAEWITNALKTAATISAMLEEIPDAELRNRIREKLKEIQGR